MAANGHCIVSGGGLTVDTFTTSTGCFVLDASGDLKVNTNKFTVAAETGNTVIAGTCGITSNATVGGTLGVTGTSTMAAINSTGTHAITGALTVSTTGTVTGNFTVGAGKFVVTAASGNLVSKGTAGFGANGTEFTVSSAGNTVVGGTLAVTGASTLTGALAANGGITVDSTAFAVADATGNTSTTGTLTVGGASALNGGITVDSNAFVVSDTTGNVSTTGTLTVAGAAAFNGGITCDTSKFIVANDTGNTSIGGSLAVTGATTFMGAFGYDSAIGESVTQETNRTTGVTCSTLTGQITTNNGSLAAGAEATFTVTNTTVAATDVVSISLATKSLTGLSIPFVSNVSAGSFDITLSNLHASVADTSESVINFVVIKGAAAT